MNRSPWRLEEVDGSPWRLEEVDGGDEQYPWSPVLRYATPLPINRTPVSTVGGPFPPFCGMPDPSRSTGSRFEHGRSNTRPFPPFCGDARPRFHRLFCPSRLPPTCSVASQ